MKQPKHNRIKMTDGDNWKSIDVVDDEDKSYSSNSSSSSLLDGSTTSSAVSISSSRIEDVTEEDSAEKRFRVMEENAGELGSAPGDGGGGGSGSQVEDALTEREDEEFCEVSPLLREKNKTFYAPDRPPPIMDFLTVITAFVVAVFAAYYTISVAEA